MLSVDGFWKCLRSRCSGHRFGHLHLDTRIADILQAVDIHRGGGRWRVEWINTLS